METKVCKKCGIVRPKTDFYKDPKAADKLSGLCKTCQMEYQREYRSRVRCDAGQHNAAKIRNRRLDAKRSGTERRQMSHRPAARKYAIIYRKANPEKVAALAHGRRVRLRGSGGKYTAAQWFELKQTFGNVCLCCGKSEEVLRNVGNQLVPDHIVSVAKGGSNDISNIQPLCHSRRKGSLAGCNNSKGSKCIDFRYLFALLVLRGGLVKCLQTPSWN